MINELGKAIRSRREELKITAEELAKKVGIDRTFVSKIENHGLLPSRLVLARIETVLKTTDLFEYYIKQKNPYLEKIFVHSSFSIPPAIRQAFQTPEAEELMRFIHRNVETTNMDFLKRDYERLLKNIAPDKISDNKLFMEILDIVKRLKKERDAYWQEFNKQSKRIKSLISDHKPTKK